MDKNFRDLSFVTCYLDDVLIHSADVRMHGEHLRDVFHHLQEAGLTLRGQKCCIGLSEVLYLGHTLSAKKMSPDNEKVQAVQEWPVPTDVTDLRSFMGLTSYYRRYIPHFANVAAPLYHLTQEGVPFVWEAEQEQAFQLLKELLTLPQF